MIRSCLTRLAATLVLMLPLIVSAKTIRVGVPAGPHAEIMAIAAEVAARNGLDLKVVTLRSSELESALASGRVDAMTGRDLIDLDAANRKHGYRLVNAGYTVTFPMGFYSTRLQRLNDLHNGDVITIPSDRRNAARALILLQNYGLLEIDDAAGLNATPDDIVSNRRGFRIRQVDQSRLMRARSQSAFVVANADTAARVKLEPARDGIGMEDARVPYAQVLAVRQGDVDAGWLRQLVAAYRSTEVKQFILHRYNDSVRRPW
ncbi:MetQ/NlpA family ABC transporter substrate-binding protein [Uliginosibacterium sp. sgz301328]|uniref:MetQ/NlpA family ABC transporter substrate-binding protein n=1 Tax=Uliginosibacterium sp. sgz301328 TaxID=3243764 RepID=UPI00359E52EF